jgi:hypothetical protein
MSLAPNTIYNTTTLLSCAPAPNTTAMMHPIPELAPFDTYFAVLFVALVTTFACLVGVLCRRYGCRDETDGDVETLHVRMNCWGVSYGTIVKVLDEEMGGQRMHV